MEELYKRNSNIEMKISTKDFVHGQENLNVDLLEQLSDIYGDAFYLLNSKRFEKNYNDLKKAFTSVYPHFNIAYSYKTNYIPKLCKIVNRYGGYAEVVSDMELELALRCGVKAEKIIWNGPIKNISEVETLLAKGGTINIDTIDEITVLQTFIKKYPNHIGNVGIRCNFDIGDGVISRFGIDIDSNNFIELLNFINQCDNLHLINLQCHFAKRVIDFWPARVSGMISIVNKVEKILGYIPERIDLGGGIFGRMSNELKEQFNCVVPEYEEYANCIKKLSHRFPDYKPELLVEPGTALAGNSMKFICRVKNIKEIRGKIFITVLGSQKNINMDGINPPIEVLRVSEGKTVQNADIVGYTCIESDVLYRNFYGKIGVNDFLIFSNCGSYSVVMKPPFIMGNFPILDIYNNQIEVIKRQEQFEDLFHTYSF